MHTIHCLEDCRTEGIKYWFPTYKSLVICVTILPAQQLLFPSILSEERTKFVVLLTRSSCYYLIISHVFWLRIVLLMGFPGGSEVKASACNVGDLGSIPGLGRSPGEGNGNPLQYSCLENPMEGGA